MPVTTLFIGSSSASKSQANAFIEKFKSPTLQFIPWWDAFTAGRTLLEDLDMIKAKIQGAVILFSPEAESIVRKNMVIIPNLNVLFEFGYFYGCLGKSKTVMLKYGEFYLPSDLGGYVYINGSKYYENGHIVPIGKKTEKDFSKWITEL